MLKSMNKTTLGLFLLFYGCLTVMGGWGLNYCLSEGRISISFLHTSVGGYSCNSSSEDHSPGPSVSEAGGHRLCSDTPFLVCNLTQRTDPGYRWEQALASIPHFGRSFEGLLLSESCFLFPPPRSAEVPSGSLSTLNNVLLL